MSRLPLVVWSGGFDSTANIINHFANKIPFETCYVKVDNNKIMQKHELKTRKKILKYLTDLYGNYHVKDNILTMHYDVRAFNFTVMLPKLWIDTIAANLDFDKYSKFVFGYISSDCFWLSEPLIAKLFEVMADMKKTENIPELDFPLKEYKKYDVYDQYYNIDKDVLKIKNMIFTCEGNTAKICGECNKCIESKLLDYEIDLRKSIEESHKPKN